MCGSLRGARDDATIFDASEPRNSSPPRLGSLGEVVAAHREGPQVEEREIGVRVDGPREAADLSRAPPAGEGPKQLEWVGADPADRFAIVDRLGPRCADGG